jgi:hypothetical protein
MRILTFFKKVLCLLALSLFAFNLNAQTIITIDNNSTSTTTYQTIQEAHDNATAGDIIYVQPSGTSYGNANIIKEITIVGRSHSEVGKVSQMGSVSIRSSNVTIKGMQFSNLSFSQTGATAPPPYVGLKLYECNFSSATYGVFGTPNFADDIEVRGCVMTSTQSIYPDSSNILFSNNIFASTSPITTYITSTLVIANNVFRSTSTITLTNNDAADGTVILFNNMFLTNSGSDRDINLNTGPFNLSNNLTYNFGFGNMNFATNATGSFTESNTLLNTDPLFTDVDNTISQSFAGASTYNPAFRPEDDLTLQAISPALTGGGGGDQIGLFNNSFNYSKLGVPRGLPTLDVVSYDGAVPKNGNINVTITAKAN